MPIYDRLARAGVRNVQVRAPKGRQTAIEDLDGRFDIVFVDAPCTGTGTWRRNPDAKWRLRPGALDERIKSQDEILDPSRTGHEARRPARLCDLFGVAGGERGPAQAADGSSSGPAADRCRSDGPFRRECRSLPHVLRPSDPVYACLRPDPTRTGSGSRRSCFIETNSEGMSSTGRGVGPFIPSARGRLDRRRPDMTG